MGKEPHLVVRLQPSHQSNLGAPGWFVGRGTVHNYGIKEVIWNKPTYALNLGSNLTKLIVIPPVKFEKVKMLTGYTAKSSVHSVDWKEVQRLLIPVATFEIISNSNSAPAKIIGIEAEEIQRICEA